MGSCDSIVLCFIHRDDANSVQSIALVQGPASGLLLCVLRDSLTKCTSPSESLVFNLWGGNDLEVKNCKMVRKSEKHGKRETGEYYK